MKRNQRSIVLVFENSLSVYMIEYCKYNLCVLKMVLIFINILCKPPLNLLFLMVWLWPSCYYPFFKIFFSLLSMCSGYSTCSKHYAFNENIHMYCFHEWDVCLIYLFWWQTQKLSNKSLLSLEKKKKLLPVRRLVKFVILPAQSIELANWFAWVPACTSATARVSLTSLFFTYKHLSKNINWPTCIPFYRHV